MNQYLKAFIITCLVFVFAFLFVLGMAFYGDLMIGLLIVGMVYFMVLTFLAWIDPENGH